MKHKIPLALSKEEKRDRNHCNSRDYQTCLRKYLAILFIFTSISTSCIYIYIMNYFLYFNTTIHITPSFVSHIITLCFTRCTYILNHIVIIMFNILDKLFPKRKMLLWCVTPVQPQSLYWRRFLYPQSLTINVPCASVKSACAQVQCDVLNLTTVLHDDNSLTRVISRTRCTYVITEVNIASKIHLKTIFFKSLEPERYVAKHHNQQSQMKWETGRFLKRRKLRLKIGNAIHGYQWLAILTTNHIARIQALFVVRYFEQRNLFILIELTGLLSDFSIIFLCHQ